MGLDMYLTRYNRHGLTDDVSVMAAANYVDMQHRNDEILEKNPGRLDMLYSFEEYCGMSEDMLPPKEVRDVFKKDLETDKYYVWDTDREYPHRCVEEDVAYWRKANAIHNWFVQNVQDGEDNCGEYPVSKEKLLELLNAVNVVLDASEMEDSWVKNGYRATPNSGGFLPVYERGKRIVDWSTADFYLPTTSGFFFGSTDYDQWYIEDLESTKKQLEKVLAETDFENQLVTYHASW